MEKATLVLLYQYMIEPMDGSSGSSLAISRLDGSMKLIGLAGRNDAGVDSPTDGEKKKMRRQSQSKTIKVQVSDNNNHGIHELGCLYYKIRVELEKVG
ncbi:hypothetical protein PIB30_036843 [Stylosanthes scabra]|uniref:Uncharacterized protein n=1 Tax=Stylosanthes scabra TaxID=79078 RepID=A0ABU6TFQ0_9FABA|nr:hypothetical protein [Stylosanthes scabra]